MDAVMPNVVLLLAVVLTPGLSRATETHSQPPQTEQQPANQEPGGSAVLVHEAAPAAPVKAHATVPNPKPRYTLDDIKGGTLFRHGVSFGVAYQVHLARASGRQTNTGFGLTPFISFFPRAWLIGDETSAYCASKWNGFNDGDAVAIADSLARERTATKANPNPTDAEVKDKTGWNVGDPGAYCWMQEIGVYAGIPSKFKADAVLTTDVSAYTEFNPMFSVGIVYSPSAYFSMLGGLTRSRIASSGGKSHLATSISIGLGGTVDVFSMLIGK